MTFCRTETPSLPQKGPYFAFRGELNNVHVTNIQRAANQIRLFQAINYHSRQDTIRDERWEKWMIILKLLVDLRHKHTFKIYGKQATHVSADINRDQFVLPPTRPSEQWQQFVATMLITFQLMRSGLKWPLVRLRPCDKWLRSLESDPKWIESYIYSTITRLSIISVHVKRDPLPWHVHVQMLYQSEHKCLKVCVWFNRDSLINIPVMHLSFRSGAVWHCWTAIRYSTKP